MADAERRLRRVPTLADAFAVIADFLLQFDDSHTTFIPPDRRVRVDYGWTMAMVGDVPLVQSVDPGSDAAAKGLAAGDRVLLLNTFAVGRLNLFRLTYIYRFIRPELRQRVAVLKPDGSARTIDVDSRVSPRRAGSRSRSIE
jgi:S1-C subfamily serine protease